MGVVQLKTGNKSLREELERKTAKVRSLEQDIVEIERAQTR